MAIPLLEDVLQMNEKVTLASLKQHPGYSVLVKLLTAACERAVADAIKLDPTEEAYERKLKYLHSRARDFNEFSKLILQSMDWHIQSGDSERVEKQAAENPKPANQSNVFNIRNTK